MTDDALLASVMRTLLTNRDVYVGFGEGVGEITIDGTTTITPDQYEAIERVLDEGPPANY